MGVSEGSGVKAAVGVVVSDGDMVGVREGAAAEVDVDTGAGELHADVIETTVTNNVMNLMGAFINNSLPEDSPSENHSVFIVQALNRIISYIAAGRGRTLTKGARLCRRCGR